MGQCGSSCDSQRLSSGPQSPDTELPPPISKEESKEDKLNQSITQSLNSINRNKGIRKLYPLQPQRHLSQTSFTKYSNPHLLNPLNKRVSFHIERLDGENYVFPHNYSTMGNNQPTQKHLITSKYTANISSTKPTSQPQQHQRSIPSIPSSQTFPSIRHLNPPPPIKPTNHHSTINQLNHHKQEQRLLRDQFFHSMESNHPPPKEKRTFKYQPITTTPTTPKLYSTTNHLSIKSGNIRNQSDNKLKSESTGNRFGWNTQVVKPQPTKPFYMMTGNSTGIVSQRKHLFEEKSITTNKLIQTLHWTKRTNEITNRRTNSINQIQLDNPSSSSSTSLSSRPRSGRSASKEPDHPISDSEFLIDDEISDQPQLTFHFNQDSSFLLHNLHSSQENLSNVFQQIELDEGHVSLESQNGIRSMGEECEGLGSDSAFSDVSSKHHHESSPPVVLLKPIQRSSKSIQPMTSTINKKPLLNKQSIHHPSTVKSNDKPTKIIQNNKNNTFTQQPIKTFSKRNIPITKQTNSTNSISNKKLIQTPSSVIMKDMKKNADIKPSLGKKGNEEEIQDILQNVIEWKQELIRLQTQLQESQRMDLIKDELIKQMDMELQILRTFKCTCGNLEKGAMELPKSTFSHVAIQTDSPKRRESAMSSEDGDGPGQLVSFRIGGRCKGSGHPQMNSWTISKGVDTE